MYKVETKVLNQAVNRNIERFPDSFRFQLTDSEMQNLRSQSVTSSNQHGGRRYLPYVFTEQGVAMLSAVLRSDTAIKVSIQIMNAFVEMRKFILNNATVFQRLNSIELQQVESNQKFEQIFRALETKNVIPTQGIFFDGQVFDAYTFVSDLIRSARESIVLVDNYVDDSVLTLLSKKSKKVDCYIFTKNVSKQLQLDADKFNVQYPILKIKAFDKAHDRFLIIDKMNVYHLGASLKDLGKKWFAFSKMEKDSVTIIHSIAKLI